MKNLSALAIGFTALTLASCAPTLQPGVRLSVAQSSPTSTSQGMTLTSPDLKEGGTLAAQQVANTFGCTSANVSPALNWTGAPAGTRSFVLTMYDPDAPTGSGFVHWVVYDIPASATGLTAGAGSEGSTLPEGAKQLNDAGGGYLGPCPPPGDKPHRYIFTLYALSEPLGLAPNSSAAVAGFSLNGKVLAKTSLTGYYSR